ncbi:MAG: ClbS/DfsB family four-helix bundle protein [Hyphomicrobiales bacterium]
MTAEGHPRTVEELVQRIHRSRAALEELVNSVPSERLLEPGEDGWSAKDHLAHIAGWERSLVELLDGRPRHSAVDATEELFASGETDAINAGMRERRAGWNLAQVLTDFQSVHEELLAALANLGGEDLQRPYREFQPEQPGPNAGAAIIEWIAGDTYDHFDEHREWIERLLLPR